MILFDNISVYNFINPCWTFQVLTWSLDKSGQINGCSCLFQSKYSDFQVIPLKQTDLIKHASLNLF